MRASSLITASYTWPSPAALAASARRRFPSRQAKRARSPLDRARQRLLSRLSLSLALRASALVGAWSRRLQDVATNLLRPSQALETSRTEGGIYCLSVSGGLNSKRTSLENAYLLNH